MKPSLRNNSNDKPSRKTISYFNVALSNAEKSNMDMRLGAVLVSGGKVVSQGHNHHRTKFGNFSFPSLHAEISCLFRFLRPHYLKSREKQPSRLLWG